MRGDPDYIDARSREQSRAAADKFSSERESYRAESEAEARADLGPVTAIHFSAPKAEVSAFRAGLAIGRRDERNRIRAALFAITQDSAALFVEGTITTRAVAGVLAALGRAVEGGA